MALTATPADGTTEILGGRAYVYQASTNRWIPKVLTLAFDDSWFYPPFSSLNAAGSTQGTAAAIVKAYTKVLAATASTADGIILPALSVGAFLHVSNGTAVALKVYPPVGGQINYAGVNAPLSLGAYSNTDFAMVSGGTYLYIQA